MTRPTFAAKDPTSPDAIMVGSDGGSVYIDEEVVVACAWLTPRLLITGLKK